LPVRWVDISIPVSDQHLRRKLNRDRQWALRRIERCVRLAIEMGFDVCVGGEDSSRADVDFLRRVIELAESSGAKRFRFADTVGVMGPFAVHRIIRQLRSGSDLQIEMHAHDDLGLATANTLAAAIAGATHVNTTVNGLGERAGNAALEEVAVALKQLRGISTGVRLDHLPQLSQQVELASGRAVGWNKSVVGRGVFSHESGIHVDGLLKDARNYQGLDPECLGRSHELLLGKHSGTRSLQTHLRDHGVTVSRREASSMLPRLRQFVTDHKRAPSLDELKKMRPSAVAGNRKNLEFPPRQTQCPAVS
jgi:homocitrate synthase NifV